RPRRGRKVRRWSGWGGLSTERYIASVGREETCRRRSGGSHPYSVCAPARTVGRRRAGRHTSGTSEPAGDRGDRRLRDEDAPRSRGVDVAGGELSPWGSSAGNVLVLSSGI